MGPSLLLLLVLIAGGFWLARRLGAPSVVTTLLNPSTARFSRHDEATDGTTVFDVTPARTSWAILLVCVLTFLIGYWIHQVDRNGGNVGFSPLLVWVFVPVFGYFLLIGARHRQPVRCSVSDQALTAGTRSWPLSEIASLQIRKGSRRGEGSGGTIVTTDPVTGIRTEARPTASLVSQLLGRRMAERSYRLTLRTRQGSAEQVLAGGLTLDCAHSLLHDLTECLNRHSGT